jgi:hypothetical protein
VRQQPERHPAQPLPAAPPAGAFRLEAAFELVEQELHA